MAHSSRQSSLDKIHKQIESCAYCLKRATGKLVPGEGRAKAKIMFVGEAPGKNEIITGQPFIGRAGKLLTNLIESVGMTRKDVFITSAVKYLPKTYVTPKPTDIIHGREHLEAQIHAIAPKVIVLLGSIAAQSVLDQKFSLLKDHGLVIKDKQQTYFLCYHPAAPLYNPKLRDVIQKDFKKLKKLL